jgi:hypothetical protein
MHASRGVPVFLMFLALCLPSKARAEAPADSTRAFDWITHHGVAWSQTSDLDVVSFFAVTSTDSSRRRPFRLDLGIHLLEAYRFGDDDRVDLAADPLVMVGTVLPFVAVSMFCESCEPWAAGLVLAVVPTWLPVIRPTGVWQPVRWAGLGVGYDSEYVFLSEDKGVTFRPFAGVQVDLGKYGRVESGVQQNLFWNWRRASEDLGTGWFVRVSLGTGWTGGGELPDPTPP